MILLKGVAGMADNQSTHEQLKRLMSDWEEQHIEESKNVVVEKIKKELIKFAPDGLIGKGDEWENANPKVLYVALAPNWEKDKYKPKYFWLQEVVYSDGKIDDGGSKILKWLLTEQCKIENKEAPKWERDYQILKNAAFMNLSKRGCRNENYEECVKQYIGNVSYRENIKSEITILKPDIIECYGTYKWIEIFLCDLITKRLCHLKGLHIDDNGSNASIHVEWVKGQG